MARSSPVIPIVAIGCFYAMWFFHRQAHPPARPPEPSAAASQVAVAPVAPVVPPPLPSATVPPAPAPTPPAPTPPPTVAADLPPPPIYTGMMKMNGQPLAVIEGRGGTFKVGDQVQNGTITEITPFALTLRYGTRVRKVPLDTNPARYVAPPKPTIPPKPAWPKPQYPLVGPLPTPPPLPPGSHVTKETFVPVTPPPLPTFAGSGSSRE